MFRSNPLGLVISVLASGALVVLWFFSEDFPQLHKLQLVTAYLALASVLGFWMWRHGLRRSRLIEDIPTSKIATAAQGYVELTGVAQQAENVPFIVGINGQDCLWRRKETAQRGASASRGSASLLGHVFYLPDEQDESHTHFAIKDETGSATIFPYRAEIIAAKKIVKYYGDTRYTEEYIVPGEPLYVLGSLNTHTSAEAPFNLLNETQGQISIWQADKKAMLRRFDKDGDGVLDMDEWEVMHNAARDLAEQKRSAVAAEPQTHTLSTPSPGLHYLISTRAPEKLVGYYRLWQNLGLVVFFAAGAVAVWLVGVLFS